MWIRTLTLLLPLLAAISIDARPVKADKAPEQTRDELRYTVSALAEMLLPVQLLACQTSYPELYPDSESWLKKLPHGMVDDPDKSPMISALQQCFAAERPLTQQQCASITDSMTQLGKSRGVWTSTQRQLAQSYLNVTKQTWPALKATADQCQGLPKK